MVLSVHGLATEGNLCFQEAERLDPQEPRWPYHQGISLLAGDPDAGRACIERAVERCGDATLTPRLYLVELLLDAGKLEEADRHLQRSLGLEPDNLRARLARGRLAVLRQEWRPALDLLAPCLADEHTARQAHTLAAQARRRLGELALAEQEDRQAASCPPDEHWPDPYQEEKGKWWRGLQSRIEDARALTRRGSLQEALDLLTETAAKYPDSVQTWLALGAVQMGQSRSLAEESFRKAVQLDPSAAEGWFRLGVVQSQDRPREAAESFRQVIGLRPDHTLAHYNLAQLLKRLGDRAGAVDEFRATLRCRPDYEDARKALKELEGAPGTAQEGK
jgi:tetratricopeptide (TPR) repeat protein